MVKPIGLLSLSSIIAVSSAGGNTLQRIRNDNTAIVEESSFNYKDDESRASVGTRVLDVVKKSHLRKNNMNIERRELQFSFSMSMPGGDVEEEEPIIWLNEKELQWLNEHNTRRKTYHEAYGVSYKPLKWSSGLTNLAQSWANQNAAECTLTSPQDEEYGVNSQMIGSGASSISPLSPTWTLNNWESKVDKGYPSNGAFTQAMWRSSEYVGCATAEGTNGGRSCAMAVCYYARPGNCGMAFSQGDNWESRTYEEDTGCGPFCPPEGCQPDEETPDDEEGEESSTAAPTTEEPTVKATTSTPTDSPSVKATTSTPTNSPTAKEVTTSSPSRSPVELSDPFPVDEGIEWLYEHNTRREAYHTGYNVTYEPLVWSPGLKDLAQSKADENAAECSHVPPSEDYGVNSIMAVGSSIEPLTAAWTVSKWFTKSRIREGYPDNGAMTQVVWRASEYVGCATAEGDGCAVAICYYARPGNCAMTEETYGSSGDWQTKTFADESACAPFCPPEGCNKE